jgi:hypothetical protein
MNFRQFAVFIVRIQGVWILFDILGYITYLATYWGRLHGMFLTHGEYSAERTAFLWELFRVAYHLAAGILCLRYADRIVSWLVKDIVPKLQPNTSPAPANCQPPAVNS